MTKCKECLKLNETPIFMDTFMESFKRNLSGMYSSYHKNGHKIFGGTNGKTA